MKAVILAGGLGTRLTEETNLNPKPMIKIGEMPLLWHIMKIYSAYGIDDFIICCGYKGYVIKEYFANYFLHNSDVTFDMTQNDMQIHQHSVEPWRVTLVDTGIDTSTGGRLRRIRDYVENESAFCLTYGDGVGNIDIGGLIAFHQQHQKLCTVTATAPPGRFGALLIDNGSVVQFEEKPRGDGGLINGGFFVVSPEAINYIDDDQTAWEQQPLRRLAAEQELFAFEHRGFWQPMDTLRDKQYLESLWQAGQAPWKIW